MMSTNITRQVSGFLYNLDAFKSSDHSFSAYAKFSEKTNISHPLIRTRTCTYQGLRNVSFSENDYLIAFAVI